MNCAQAKKIDLVQYLKKQGYQPKKRTQKDVWFLSPFSNEKTPSFKVCIQKNIWICFSSGLGGTIIDFVMRINLCSIQEALAILDTNTFSFHKQIEPTEEKSSYSLNRIAPLTNHHLLTYLKTRRLNLSIAQQNCSEVYYSFDQKKEYYAIGFKNNSGGYELRNNFFKGCFGKKDITTISNKAEALSMFESWSDYLSYLTLNKTTVKEDVIILNSTNMVSRLISLDMYKTIKLFFDNDSAGNNATNYILNKTKTKVIDYRRNYKSYKDLNEYLVSKISKDKTTSQSCI